MLRIVLAFLLTALVFVDIAPVYAQDDGRIHVAQQERRRTLMDLLFGAEPTPAPPVQQPQQETRRSAPATAALPPPEPAVEKAANATRLAVFGDSLAVDLAKGLDRFYREDPNLVVIDQGVGSSGFVREDYFDWEGAIDEQIAANSFDLAVVIIGINDRQIMMANGVGYEALSEGWKTEYQRRITVFLNKLRAANKPVVWVGLPPMSKVEYAGAMTQIAAIQQLASFSGGAQYLDIYERFLGEDGKYSSYGPDVNGQNARMRKDDGIHFSSAGADKLAFYLSQSIRTFYRGGGGVSVAVADPLAGTDAAGMLRPPYQGLGQIRLLEVAGAVIPLSQSPNRAGDLLTATSLPETPPFSLEQLMTAPMGRADAFGVGVDPEAEEPVPSPAAALSSGR